jgi:hypothetical protein
MRAAFEEWAEAGGYNMSKEIQPLNSYVGATTRLAWYGWQAARAVQAAEIARLTAELANVKQIPEGYALAPIEPDKQQINIGTHVNSEWLNDNAPMGESRYKEPAIAVYKKMIAAAPKPPGAA